MTGSRHWWLLGLGILLDGGFDAQQDRRIDASKGPSCAKCTIELTPVASLGSLDHSDTPAFYSAIAVDRSGRAFVTGQERTSILVFDQKGALIKTLGRAGGGPGEFRYVVDVGFGPGDSLLVADGSLLAIYSPALEFVRRVPNPLIPPTVPLWLSGGRMVFGTLLRNASDGKMYPLSVVDADGRNRAAFGIDSSAAESRPACKSCLNRALASSKAPGRFWAALPNRYEIEEWNAERTRTQRVIVVGSPWFTPWTTDQFDVRDPHPPHTVVDELHEDGRGQLWVSGRLPPLGWTPLPRPKEPPPPVATRPNSRISTPAPKRAQGPSPEMMKRRATMIEVLDPASGRVVVSRRFDGRGIHLISPALAYEIREDSDGVPIVHLYRVTIAGGPSR